MSTLWSKAWKEAPGGLPAGVASGLGLGVLLRQLEGKEREDGDWRKGAKGFGIGPGGVMGFKCDLVSPMGGA